MYRLLESKTMIILTCVIIAIIANVFVGISVFSKSTENTETGDIFIGETNDLENESAGSEQQDEIEVMDANTEYENISVVEDVVFTNLFDLQALYKNGGDMIFSHCEDTGRPDNVGTLYSSGAYELYASGDDRSIIFPLDEKYTSLSGTLAIRQNDSHESLWLEFYSGDTLIGKTEVLKDGVRPINFSVDVSGVVDLTLVAKTETGYGFAYTDGFYLE